MSDDDVSVERLPCEFDSGDGGGFVSYELLIIRKGSKVYVISSSSEDWAVDWVREHG